MLEVRNLCKKFEDPVAVDSIGFVVKENEIFGLIGADGAGKTDPVVLEKLLLAVYLFNIRLEKG